MDQLARCRAGRFWDTRCTVATPAARTAHRANPVAIGIVLAQEHKAKQWLEQQLEKLLPCAYFLITFTLPQNSARSHASTTTVLPSHVSARRRLCGSWPPTRNMSAPAPGVHGGSCTAAGTHLELPSPCALHRRGSGSGEDAQQWCPAASISSSRSKQPRRSIALKFWTAWRPAARRRSPRSGRQQEVGGPQQSRRGWASCPPLSGAGPKKGQNYLCLPSLP